MNKRQKQVVQHQLTFEKLILDMLEEQYREVLKDINLKIQMFQAMPETQSKIYHRQYQETLKKQVEAAQEKLHSDEYTTIEQYLHDTYTDAFAGTMYDLHGQGVPVIAPIDQKAVIRAVLTDSKLKKRLYDSLGVDVNKLKQAVSQEISRGIASGLLYDEIARNIQFRTNAPLKRAKTIVRTEGHRIQQASADDARQVAKSKGADVVKQWDATMDGKTRPSHRRLDGQIREVDEPFELGTKKAMYPGEFGYPEEDCNCRCVALTRARSALDADELKIMQDRAKAFKLDKTKDFEDFKKKYLNAAETVANTEESDKMGVADSDESVFAEKVSKQNGITKPYEDVLNAKFANGTQEGKQAFTKFVHAFSVDDPAFADTPHFDPVSLKVNMNFSEDAVNPRGAGTTYFHEHGHYVDFMAAGAGNYQYMSSNSNTFAGLLMSDYKAYVSAYKKANNLKAADAYIMISIDLVDHKKHAVSDLMGGLSNGKCMGRYGHNKAYWKQQGNLEHEAFAHMFEALFDNEKTNLMQQYFPNAFAEFQKMLKGVIK